MKKIILACAFSISLGAMAQTPCDSGMAGAYPCSNFDLQSNIPVAIFGATSGNDTWGWTDPQDGKEYAIMGVKNGTVFIDISDPVNPVYLGKLDTHTSSSEWRDIKTLGNYALIGSEAAGHGMQIFDLTRLRNVASPPVTFTEDAHYDGFGNSHNIVVNEDSGYAFGVGTNTFSGGPHFVDMTDPLNPVGAGGWSGDGYSHDGQVVTYNGPDSDYTGKEIFIGSNENEVVFVDITDKSNPQHISSVSYNNIGYTHQGWFTEDQAYFITTDELDEVFFGFNLRLIVLDANDLDNPSVHFEYLGPTTASDHNVFVKGDKAYASAYRGGLRVMDVSDIANNNMPEIGFFDTWPADDNASASVGDPGAWGAYPFFESGNIVISNYSDAGGFFLVREQSLSVNDENVQAFSVAPNPAKNVLNFRSNSVPITSIAIYDLNGRLLIDESIDAVTQKTLAIDRLAQGIYIAVVNNIQSIKIAKE
ncbi:choice-of-anchor B family protein [Aureisphaera galaxeae]|uniref:choice-of-anchor B family protein n=1 Tax=Aureisphaera galaxeae TaxID=1538023 RepID=UPI00235043F4|nr:choice-of-anchor B family protein [Aureisphaera galaxeae]MDC8004577.1 choice-of-anchor B family protein [Aureisphaera galaxeae]